MTYEYEGKTEKEAIEKAAAELGLEKDQFDVEILESQKKTLFKNGYVKIRVHTVDSKNQVSPEFDGKVPNATTRANDPSLVSNPLPQDEVEEKIGIPKEFAICVSAKTGENIKDILIVLYFSWDFG